MRLNRLCYTLSAVSIVCSTVLGDDIALQSLERAKTQLHEAIEAGEVAGGAHLVVRDGKTRYLEVAGVCDIEDQRPLKADTIVRIYSMTKPITSVAAMMLFEQGKFQLDDPVGKFIPAFAETTVLEKDGDSVKIVPANRAITVRDVFRHTTGFNYGDGDARKYYEREGMRYRPPAAMLPPKMSIQRAAESLARIPALHHPGERFTYGFNTDLLGRLIEVWSGDRLDEYMRQAVFEPLEMVDTGFSVAKEKRDRLASCHTLRDGKLSIVDKASSSDFNEGFEFLSGGGGLVSTIKDYANFCEMLVDGGAFKGERLLKKETVELMFTDQLNGVAGNFRFGLGFAIGEVQLGSGETARRASQYSWGGYASTDFRLVPEEKLFQIVVRQRVPSSHGLANKLFPIIYQGVGLLPVKGTRQVSSAEDADWPGWLGPKRNGWVSGFQPPTRWPKSLKKSWQVEVGTGYGSPLVSFSAPGRGGRVYQHARQGDDEVVWCLDLETGGVKWRKSYAAPFKIGGGGEYHGKGPKSCPALADGRLFTLSIAGILTAWDAASGERRWRRDYSSRFESGHPYWGVATSPLVDGNRVVVHFGTDGEGVLVALDVESGEEVWSHGKDAPSYSSPLVVEIEGVRQIVEWNQRVLAGVESESGRLLWEYPFPQVKTDQNMPTPAFHRGIVLLGAENRGVRGLEPKLDGGVWTVKERWHQRKVAHDMSSAVVNGDLLYGFSHYGQGRLFCLDPKTGEVLWQGPGRTGDNVMFLAIPGHVVALKNDGELQIIAARGDRFDKVASYRVAESPTWAPPVLLKRGILVKDRQTLTLWSLPEATARSPSGSR